jgi:hypothetical protein
MDSREQLIREIAKERDDYRERALAAEKALDQTKMAARNLWVALQDVASNIDVSTIRPGKRNDARWGALREQSAKVLDLTRALAKF